MNQRNLFQDDPVVVEAGASNFVEVAWQVATKFPRTKTPGSGMYTEEDLKQESAISEFLENNKKGKAVKNFVKRLPPIPEVIPPGLSK